MTHRSIQILISLFLLTTTTNTLNIPLTRSRETCLTITQGSYEFQYVVSGNSEKEVRCVIQEANNLILEVIGKSQYEGDFQIKENQASICFSALDTHAKSVSFDFIKKDDPLRGLIEDKQKMQIHQTLYNSYQQLEKLYRDQHFFLERNYIHEILLRNTEVVLIFFVLLKLMIVFICAFFQLYFVKRIFEHNYKSVAMDESRN